MAWTLLLLGGVLAMPASALAAVTDVDLSDVTVPLCTSTGISAVNDIHSRRTEESVASQRVDADDDDILLGIALANNGASDVTWENLRDVSKSQTQRITASQTANLDREDVFSALALGVDADAGSLEALACVADIVTAATATRTLSRTSDLDEETVLLAIALHNSVGADGDFSYLDVANIDESDRSDWAHDQEVTVPRDDSFLALALGAGGSA